MLDFDIRSSESFKSKALNFICPNCLNPKGVKVFTRLQLGWSHLQDQSSNTVFKTVSNLYTAAVLKSRQLLIICFTASTTYTKQKPLWVTSILLGASLDDSSNTFILNTATSTKGFDDSVFTF